MFKEREEIRDAIATEPKSVIAGAIIEDGDRKHGAHANPSEGRVELYLAEIVPPSMQWEREHALPYMETRSFFGLVDWKWSFCVDDRSLQNDKNIFLSTVQDLAE